MPVVTGRAGRGRDGDGTVVVDVGPGARGGLRCGVAMARTRPRHALEKSLSYRVGTRVFWRPPLGGVAVVGKGGCRAGGGGEIERRPSRTRGDGRRGSLGCARVGDCGPLFSYFIHRFHVATPFGTWVRALILPSSTHEFALRFIVIQSLSILIFILEVLYNFRT
jgi:hypothetical protein